MDDLELRTEADAILAELVGDPGGSARLREDQWQAVAALVQERRRALVVQRTGWGKSAVYFVATALLRRRGCGPTVIVSPLLALMRNQVESAARAGIRARTINSANPEEWDTIYGEVERGEDRSRQQRRQPQAPRQPSQAGQGVTPEQRLLHNPGGDNSDNTKPYGQGQRLLHSGSVAGQAHSLPNPLGGREENQGAREDEQPGPRHRLPVKRP